MFSSCFVPAVLFPLRHLSIYCRITAGVYVLCLDDITELRLHDVASFSRSHLLYRWGGSSPQPQQRGASLALRSAGGSVEGEKT